MPAYVEQQCLPSHLTYLANNRLSDINLEANKTHNTIQTLDRNKVHGHDDILIRILKLCNSSLVKSLSLML